MVRIHVISGFLGAGKTTLIKKLLTGRLRNEKVVLLENEYGDVGVDGAFLKDVGIQVSELNAGCICCTLAGDFQDAIDELITKYQPTVILVEPTGVGKLSEILSAIEKAKQTHPEIEIGGCATVVDAGKARMCMRNYGEFYVDQVRSASTIIFSRTQLLDPARVEKSRVLIAETHPEARIITTPWDDMEPDFMLDVIVNGRPIEFPPMEDEDDEDEDEHEHHHHDHDDEDEHEHHHHDHDDDDDDDEHEHHHHDHDDDDDDDEHEHHHHDHDDDEDEHEHHHHDHDDDEDEHEHHHHDHDEHGHHHHHHHHHGEGEHDADEVFQNIGVETANRYSREEIRGMLEQLSDEEEYGRVLRAKGVLQEEDGAWFQFDWVPGEIEIRDGSPDYTGRFCVIGANVDEKALRELFRA